MFKDGKIGLISAICAGVGLIVATNVLMTLSQGVGYSGRGFIIAMAVVCILNIFVALSFAELNSLIPGTGSISHYTLAAMGPLPSMIAVVGGYLICQIFAATAEAALLGFVVNATFLPNVPPVVISIVAVVILYMINVLGVESYATTQIVVTLFLIISMLAFGIIGVTNLTSATPVVQATTSFNPLGWGIFTLAPMAFWLFIGVEFITPLTKDLRNPKRDVPLSMVLGLVLLFVVQTVMTFAIYKYVPADILTTSTQPHVDFARILLGQAGLYWMGAISLCAAASTLNTTFSAISRMCLGMAVEGMLPKIFARKSKRNSPVWGLTILFVLFFVVLVTGVSSASDIVFLILTGCLFWMVAYVIAHIDLLILRKKYPDRERSFKSFGKGIPQIIGIVGTIIMIVNIHPDPAMRSRIYTMAIIWAVILVVYSILWIKLKMKTELFKTVPIDEILERENV
ncbi:MAG: APC family permease [Clostridiales bacterium]|nr:APC family permease [Clostridiales bacterium]